MSSVPDNRASASAASEQTSPTYTFRTMRELDALIAKADLRVQRAQTTLQQDCNDIVCTVEYALTLRKLARKVKAWQWTKVAMDFLFKRR